LQEERNVALLQVAAPAQFMGDSSETSSDQRSAVLKAMTRIGLLYWPPRRSWMTVSRSASRQARPFLPKSSATK
jgi:hypothetical protein